MLQDQIKIVFKNVGQGDSIIFEWLEDSKIKIGILDCNKFNDGNPVIEYLESIKKDYDIEFLILSHPHYDHFSGFLKLLEYLEQQKKVIKCIFHTAIYSQEFLGSELEFSKKYLSSVIGANEKNELKILFGKIHQMNRDSLYLKEVEIISNKTKVELNDYFSLESLSPSFGDELVTYMNGNFLSEEIHKTSSRILNNNNPKTNHISTILSLKERTNKWQFMFFSDATTYSIKRIKETKDETYFNNLICAQPAHHGSAKNHYAEFWDTLTNKPIIPTFVSVGNKYGHPSEEVVQYFDQNFGDFHCTNDVGGYSKFYSPTKKPKTSKALDTFSKKTNRSKSKSKTICGEKMIILNRNGISSIRTADKFLY